MFPSDESLEDLDEQDEDEEAPPGLGRIMAALPSQVGWLSAVRRWVGRGGRSTCAL